MVKRCQITTSNRAPYWISGARECLLQRQQRVSLGAALDELDGRNPVMRMALTDWTGAISTKRKMLRIAQRASDGELRIAVQWMSAQDVIFL